MLLADEGLAPRTQNYYRGAVGALFNWLTQTSQWNENPVKAVRPVQFKRAETRRRALRREELEALVEEAPPHRGTCYLLAATSGLRRGELEALRWGDVDLEEGTVQARASTTKNRKAAVLPLPPGTVAALREHKGAVLPSAPVFKAIPQIKTFYRDLERAGIEKVNGEGKVDFHALRVTYCTLLAREGVPLALAQKLMRHSTPELTANIYTRLELHDGRAAVDRIDLGSKEGDPIRRAAER